MLQIGENIKLIRSLAGKTQPEFAIIISENLSNLKTYETKDVMPKPHIQHRLAKMAGVSLQDLLNKALTPDDIVLNLEVGKVKKVNNNTPVGSLEAQGSAHQKTYQEERLDKKNATVPFLVTLVPVKAQAGYAQGYNNTDFLNQLEPYPILPGVDPHGAVWRYFQVDGRSMEPTLKKDQYVLASQVLKEDWGELKDWEVYVIVTEEKVLIKRVAKKRGKDYWVIDCDNSEFKQLQQPIAEVKELWKYRRHVDWNASPPRRFEIKV